MSDLLPHSQHSARTEAVNGLRNSFYIGSYPTDPRSIQRLGRQALPALVCLAPPPAVAPLGAAPRA